MRRFCQVKIFSDFWLQWNMTSGEKSVVLSISYRIRNANLFMTEYVWKPFLNSISTVILWKTKEVDHWTSGTEEQSVERDHVIFKRILKTCIIQLQMSRNPTAVRRICVLIWGLKCWCLRNRPRYLHFFYKPTQTPAPHKRSPWTNKYFTITVSFFARWLAHLYHR